jgi:small subunit ribosomal protein S8
MTTDPIADYLTRVRNAIKANHRVVEIPASNIKKEITKVLFDKGYIANYKFEDAGIDSSIKIALKYHPITKTSAIRKLQRISKPGLRSYVKRQAFQIMSFTNSAKPPLRPWQARLT